MLFCHHFSVSNFTAFVLHDSGSTQYAKALDFQDSAILVLNKPPKVPMKGHLPVHNSMDVLAAAALSYGNEEGPKLVRSLCCLIVSLQNLVLVHYLGSLRIFVPTSCGHRFID